VSGTASRVKAPWVIAVVVVLVAAGVTLVIADPFTSKTSGHPGVADNSYPTSLATVKRQTISSQTPVSATLGYAGSYSVINQACGAFTSLPQACGTFTSLPQAGQVISQGRVLYRVDGNPVVLLYGATPAYRTLSPGATGADVRELNADLVALGDVTASQLSPTADSFGSATTAALEKLQADLGVTQNGTLTLGQAAFLPGPIRVTTVAATLGGSAARACQPAACQLVLSATSTTRQVTIALDTALQSEVKVGDKVTITLPDNTTTPGVITSVGSVATAPSSSGGSGDSGSNTPTVIVEATPTHPAATGTWDQAPVQVSITTVTVSNALVVPEDALMALSGGGYAVEVVDHGGAHHLVDVNLGIFDPADGEVQVSGSGLAAGQNVVVPGS
jgi:hypothetical protein